MTNGDRFEAAYNKIDKHLRSNFDMNRWQPFSYLIKEIAQRNHVVERYKDDLLEYADLRNAIVHTRGVDPHIIADPRDEAVYAIEKIADRLTSPKRLRSLTFRGPLRIFLEEEPLPAVLAYLKEHDFSQAIILRNGDHGILSAEGISLWLESKVSEDILELSQTRISDALCFEPKDTCVFMGEDSTVEEAANVFEKDTAKRVFSVIVTKKGKRSENPIMVLTPWDYVSGRLQ